MSDEIKELKDAEQTETGRKDGANMAWVPGLVMIGIGILFLLNNFTDFRLNNWWALFILIPAFGSLGNFWRAYRSHGRMNGEAAGSLVGSMAIFLVAAIFLFGWNWGSVWPFFLIIAGLGALLSGLFD
jgi:hypothetical protein